MRLDPEDLRLRASLGRLLLQGVIEDALPHLSLAAQDTTDNESARGLGQAYSSLGRHAEARSPLEQAVSGFDSAGAPDAQRTGSTETLQALGGSGLDRAFERA